MTGHSKERFRAAKDHLKSLAQRRHSSITQSLQRRKSSFFHSEHVEASEPERPKTAFAEIKAVHGLHVSIRARFEAPLDQTFFQEYTISPDVDIHMSLYDALLGRIHHACQEMITRYDTAAIDATSSMLQREPLIKPARYHLTFRIDRLGSPLAERHFTSYQQEEMTTNSMYAVLIEAYQAVGFFLQAHDPIFEWKWPDEIPRDHEGLALIAPPAYGSPQSLRCVPFSANHRGFTIEVAAHVKTRDISLNKTFHVNSYQWSPLTLRLGEGISTKISDIFLKAQHERETIFDDRHLYCSGFEGANSCSHYEDGAFEMTYKVRNELGPDFPHWESRIMSSKIIFNSQSSVAFDRFMSKLQRDIEITRDEADDAISALDDVKFEFMGLRGNGWEVGHLMTATIDKEVITMRPVVKVLLERLQVRVRKILAEYGASVTLTIHKRGQLIVDTILRGNEESLDVHYRKLRTPEIEQHELRAALRDCLEQTYRVVCKDTCAIGATDPVNLHITEHHAGPIEQPSPMTVTETEPDDATPHIPQTPIAKQAEYFPDEVLSSVETAPPEQDSVNSSPRPLSRRSALDDLRHSSPEIDEPVDDSIYGSNNGQHAIFYGFDGGVASSTNSLPSLTDSSSLRANNNIGTPATIHSRYSSYELDGSMHSTDEESGECAPIITRRWSICAEVTDLGQRLEKLHNDRLASDNNAVLTLRGHRGVARFFNFRKKMATLFARRFMKTVASPLDLVKGLGRTPDQMVQMSLRQVIVPFNMRRFASTSWASGPHGRV